jgi:hypothetical protein
MRKMGPTIPRATFIKETPLIGTWRANALLVGNVNRERLTNSPTLFV